MFQMVAVIVDKCLEMVLKTATVDSWPPVKITKWNKSVLRTFMCISCATC
ncbi:hypothetical protein T4B_14909 [Trichinella pseudospiralis]|uniref:Uncharacterized protein n=1 Tax=Trichinella pseudospiralis TaxID=6337 RepID=A0A0V1GP68_TRIPS|nr:hypothetical protein T4B_14909 [Trichinella pseudospiralis]